MRNQALTLLVVALCLLLKSASAKETITFEPYTDEEKPYLIDGGTHNFNRMVADFGAGFTNNHFRFADMNAFWKYKFEFDKPVIATAIMDLGAEFKVSIAISEKGEKDDYVVVLEEKNHVHNLANKEVRKIEFSDSFDKPGKIVWIKFEDSLPQDGWGPYLDSFTLEYAFSAAIRMTGKLSTTWASVKAR